MKVGFSLFYTFFFLLLLLPEVQAMNAPSIKAAIGKEKCVICLEAFEESTKTLSILRCNYCAYHPIHISCLAPIALQDSAICPICRTPLPEDIVLQSRNTTHGIQPPSLSGIQRYYRFISSRFNRLPVSMKALTTGLVTGACGYCWNKSVNESLIRGTVLGLSHYLGSSESYTHKEILRKQANTNKWLQKLIIKERVIRSLLWGLGYTGCFALCNLGRNERISLRDSIFAFFLAGIIIEGPAADFARPDPENLWGKFSTILLLIGATVSLKPL
jgi:hypothetical protein